MYFSNVKTLDDAKNLFRKLCKQLHPDTSGYKSQNDFVKMFKEFRSFKPELETEEDKNFDASKFYNLLKQLDVLNDVQILFIGSFIWIQDLISGASYLQKDLLKTINLEGSNNARFAPKKKLWYFSPKDYVQKSRSKKDMEELKSTYGCESYKSNGLIRIS